MKIGDKAPEILGKDEQGRDIRLSDYKGRKLVLYFYPKDNTSGCTAEACSLRDRYAELQGAGYEVVGVSKDSAASHQKFKEKHALPFPLIADVDKTLLEIRPAVVALIAVPTFRMGQSAKLNRYTIWIPVACALAIWALGVSPIYIIIIAAVAGYIYGRWSKKELEEVRRS